MGLFGKIATLASIGLPAKAVKNAIAGRAAASAATKTTGAASGGTPPPPPPPGAAGGSASSRAKTMTGGSGGFQSPPPPPKPPPPKAGQNVYVAGADFNKKTKPERVGNAWREGGKK